YLIGAAQSAASVIRDRFSPDAWRALTDLFELINAPIDHPPTESAIFERTNGALRIIASFSGLAQENMSQLAGWRFLELGRRIERAIATCRFVRQFAFAKLDGTLDVLLELADSQITYRLRYVMVASRAPVIDLVVLDPNNPRSPAYQLAGIEPHLAALPQRNDDGRLSPPEQIATALATEADGVGVVAGRRDDRLHRRVAAVLDEDLEFLGVQLAIGRERIVAGVGADQQLDAELARLVHQLAKQVEVSFHAIDVELHLLGFDRLAELDHDRQEGGSGNDRHAALGDRFEVAVGGEIGMNDPVDAGLGGGAGGPGTARMNADAQVAPVRLAHHGCDLVFRQHLRLAGAAVRHLDEVDAVFALPADLGDHLVRGVAEPAHGVIGRSLPRRLIVLDAAVGDDHAARDVHARPLHQAELDGIAHADIGEPGAARHRDAGDTGAQHLLHAASGLERGEFRPRGALAF